MEGHTWVICKCYAILYKGLQILVSVGGAETTLSRVSRDDCHYLFVVCFSNYTITTRAIWLIGLNPYF